MILNIKLRADDSVIRHAEIVGSIADKDALLALLEEVMPDPIGALAKLRIRAAAPVVESRPAEYRIDWDLLQKAEADYVSAFERVKRENTDEALQALTAAQTYRDSWAGHYLCRALANRKSPSPLPVATAEAGRAGQWLDPNRGPRSEWQGDTQVLHPVLVAREDAEEAELAYWCDMNDEWLTFKNGERQRIYDVEGWQPLPAMPGAAPQEGGPQQ